MALPQRKRQRLQGYDYKKGAYFITICIAKNQQPLSKISRDNPCGCPKPRLTLLGSVCEKTLKTVEEKYNVIISDYIIMPDHIHLILFMNEDDSRTTARVVPTVSSIVGAYKSLVSTEWLKICKENNRKMNTLWERSFYDHIIRNDEDLYCKQQYIQKIRLNGVLRKGLYCD